MSANYTPNLGEYTELTPFRYWCQKVLPLVYDDSLSYYELLCKVLDYLNKTMHDVDTLHGDVVNLHTAYKKLQEYVNIYFDTLDVQEEINNKLDKMASDGSLLTIISPTISDETAKWLSKNITNPTNPVVDKSLTVNGAAADAFKAGYYSSKLAVKVTKDLGIKVSTDIDNITVSISNSKSDTYVWSERYYVDTLNATSVTIPFQTRTVIAWIEHKNEHGVLRAAYESDHLIIPPDGIVIYIAYTENRSNIHQLFNIDYASKYMGFNDIDATLTKNDYPADSFKAGYYSSKLAVHVTKALGIKVSTDTDNITVSISNSKSDTYVWSERYYVDTLNATSVTIPFQTRTVIAWIEHINEHGVLRAGYESDHLIIPPDGIVIYIAYTENRSNIHQLFNIDYASNLTISAKTPGFFGKRVVFGGDSITHGVGGSNWNQNGRTIITVDGRTWKESPNSYSWANLMINLLKNQYDCSVTNNACTGTNTQFWSENIADLLPKNTDIFILTIGTNDRNFDTLELCHQHIVNYLPSIITYCRMNNIRICVFSPVPASQINEDSKKAKTWQINEWIREVCFQYNAEYYNLHDYIYNWYFSRNEPIGTYSDGLHPNDAMYYYMFYAYCNLLDISPSLPVLEKP